MKVDHSALYNSALDFFDPSGNAIMKLTSAAAKLVCREAAVRDLIVVRIEGGIRSDKGFEARLDCIWDGLDPPAARPGVEENNAHAEQFIINQSGLHNAFIITAAPASGYRSG